MAAKSFIRQAEMEGREPPAAGCLLIGIGNPSRGDDALGWAFLDHFDENEIRKEYRYQLNIEDASLLTSCDIVIFVDASRENLPDGFSLEPCVAAPHYFFSSHQQSPSTILYLCREIFGKVPKACLLAISGYQWELGEEISEKAKQNLQKAVDQLRIKNYELRKINYELKITNYEK